MPAHERRRPRRHGLPRRPDRGAPPRHRAGGPSSCSSPATRSTPTTCRAACCRRSTPSAGSCSGSPRPCRSRTPPGPGRPSPSSPSQRRRRLVREIGRFSTNDGLHHLLSYGELRRHAPARVEPAPVAPAGDGRPRSFVASDRVAPTTCRTGRRTTRRRTASPATEEKTPLELWRRGAGDGLPARTSNSAEVFRAAVPRVARALANSATYMIFDDHEVTDDWYLRSAGGTGADGAVRAGGRPQRLRRLHGLPGLGQRPARVHPARPARSSTPSTGCRTRPRARPIWASQETGRARVSRRSSPTTGRC